MLGVSHAVEVLVLGPPVVVYKIPYSNCVFKIQQQLKFPVLLTDGFSLILIEYFVVFLSCVYRLV